MMMNQHFVKPEINRWCTRAPDAVVLYLLDPYVSSSSWPLSVSVTGMHTPPSERSRPEPNRYLEAPNNATKKSERAACRQSELSLQYQVARNKKFNLLPWCTHFCLEYASICWMKVIAVS